MGEEASHKPISLTSTGEFSGEEEIFWPILDVTNTSEDKGEDNELPDTVISSTQFPLVNTYMMSDRGLIQFKTVYRMGEAFMLEVPVEGSALGDQSRQENKDARSKLGQKMRGLAGSMAETMSPGAIEEIVKACEEARENGSPACWKEKKTSSK